MMKREDIGELFVKKRKVMLERLKMLRFMSVSFEGNVMGMDMTGGTPGGFDTPMGDEVELLARKKFDNVQDNLERVMEVEKEKAMQANVSSYGCCVSDSFFLIAKLWTSPDDLLVLPCLLHVR